MDEFNNRIEAQRIILEVINSKSSSEPLFGLSKGAIDRWRNSNTLKEDDAVLKMLYNISAKLFFLANKSQEQISERYQSVNAEIKMLMEQLKLLILKN